VVLCLVTAMNAFVRPADVALLGVFHLVTLPLRGSLEL
jgi:hypothetical protein